MSPNKAELVGLPIRLSFSELPTGHYMTLNILETSSPHDFGRLIIKYELDAKGQLRIAFPNQQAVVEAIEADELEGHIDHHGEFRLVRVSSPAESVEEVIESRDRVLFKDWIELEEVSPARSHSPEDVDQAEDLISTMVAARSESTPVDELVRIAQHPNPTVRAQVCQNPSATESVLAHLASDPNSGVASCVARRERVSWSLMKQLAAHHSDQVRSTLAQSKYVDPKILNELASDPVSNVRAEVAMNPSTPQGTLAQLALDAEPHVRGAVGSNLVTRLDTLEVLATDVEPIVRLRVISERLPYEVLNNLYDDTDENVRRRAATVLEQLDRQMIQEIQRGVRPETELIERLAQSKNVRSRRFIAQHASTPEHVLLLLSADSDDHIRKTIARNPATPTSALVALAASPQRDLKEVLISFHRKNGQVMELLAEDPDPYVRGFVAATAADIELRMRLLKDPDRRVRYGLLLHDSVPLEVAQALAKDPDPEIRSVASRWLAETPPESWPRPGGVGTRLMIEAPEKGGD
jgi:hypothetical protein